MHANNHETIYSAWYGDWTQARLITASGSARTVPMSHRDYYYRNYYYYYYYYYYSRLTQSAWCLQW